MKKLAITLLVMTVFASGAFAFSFPFFKKKPKTINTAKPVNTEIQTLELFNSEPKSVNTVWAGTFELVWNDLMDNVIGAPIVFSNGKSKLAEEFNKQNFKKESLSESSYYVAHGWMTKALKSKIEKGLKDKFNETSDILGGLQWSERNFLIYAMLKKDFEFINAFTELPSNSFAKSADKVKYFGVNGEERENAKLRNSVTVLFYNSSENFAVELATKTDDKVLLYRTDDVISFEKAYSDMMTKSNAYKGNKNMLAIDRLKVPNVDFKTKHFYTDLQGKMIKNTDFMIMQALETIDFKMDNKGVKLKSEAAIVMRATAVGPGRRVEPRYFYLDDPYYLYLIEKDKPYFALHVGDTKPLVK